jgi:hypothetical protein
MPRTVRSGKFTVIDKTEAYAWIAVTLKGYNYRKLSRHERGLVIAYIQKLTGYKQRQTNRLIAQWMKTTKLTRKVYKHHKFNGKYTRADCILLAQVDEAHSVLSGPATRLILEREYVQFGKPEYERLAGISVSHIYNLRKTYLYHQHAAVFTKTKGPKNTLGLRRKPEPNGKPGYIRIDTEHQGDGSNGEKGVYNINFVDEVTQWEFVACVPTICDRDMLPILEAILALYPFVIIEFHADNGSEYINKLVAKLLNRLHITLSKSRPRRHNDNALVETKNGGIIRKHMGYNHIPKDYAGAINSWYQQWFNTYLNYHRPCGFATTTVDHKGKERKVYKPKDYMTPYSKLKSLPSADQYLKPNVSFAQLDRIAYLLSDTDYAIAMMKAKYQLMGTIDAKLKELPME